MLIDLDLRSLIYKELYRNYGIHFLDYDIYLNSIVDEDSNNWLEDGCTIEVDVRKHIYE